MTVARGLHSTGGEIYEKKKNQGEKHRGGAFEKSKRVKDPLGGAGPATLLERTIPLNCAKKVWNPRRGNQHKGRSTKATG